MTDPDPNEQTHYGFTECFLKWKLLGCWETNTKKLLHFEIHSLNKWHFDREEKDQNEKNTQRNSVSMVYNFNGMNKTPFYCVRCYSSMEASNWTAQQMDNDYSNLMIFSLDSLIRLLLLLRYLHWNWTSSSLMMVNGHAMDLYQSMDKQELINGKWWANEIWANSRLSIHGSVFVECFHFNTIWRWEMRIKVEWIEMRAHWCDNRSSGMHPYPLVRLNGMD